MKETLKRQIAMQSAAGREAEQVWQKTLEHLSPQQRLLKPFELTELARQAMRAGLREQFPDESEEEIQRRYVDQLLSHHGLSLEKVRQMQAELPD